MPSSIGSGPERSGCCSGAIRLSRRRMDGPSASAEARAARSSIRCRSRAARDPGYPVGAMVMPTPPCARRKAISRSTGTRTGFGDGCSSIPMPIPRHGNGNSDRITDPLPARRERRWLPRAGSCPCSPRLTLQRPPITTIGPRCMSTCRFLAIPGRNRTPKRPAQDDSAWSALSTRNFSPVWMIMPTNCSRVRSAASIHLSRLPNGWKISRRPLPRICLKPR